MKEAQPDLDIGRLARMGAFDDPAVSRIIEKFLQTLDERIAAMEAASAEGDYKRLSRLAHQLRGSAANCGFSSLAGWCTALDGSPDSYDIGTFQSLVERARAAWNHARRI